MPSGRLEVLPWGVEQSQNTCISQSCLCKFLLSANDFELSYTLISPLLRRYNFTRKCERVTSIFLMSQPMFDHKEGSSRSSRTRGPRSRLAICKEGYWAELKERQPSSVCSCSRRPGPPPLHLACLKYTKSQGLPCIHKFPHLSCLSFLRQCGTLGPSCWYEEGGQSSARWRRSHFPSHLMKTQMQNQVPKRSIVQC